jgi:hypothetical protein
MAPGDPAVPEAALAAVFFFFERFWIPFFIVFSPAHLPPTL